LLPFLFVLVVWERSRVNFYSDQKMEMGDDGDGDEKKSPAVADGGGSGAGAAGWSSTDRPTKRMMKSPYQLEVLEKTYASTSISSLL
jgi:hypothetical protein